MAGDADWAGVIYRVLEEHGELTDALIGSCRADRTDEPPEIVHLPHARFDGLGAMAQVLRGRGADVKVPRRRESRPGWLERLRLLFRHARHPPAPAARWRGFDVSFTPRDPQEARPRAIAWTLFSRAESESLAVAAEDGCVPLNSLLLWTLQRALADELEAGSGALTWLVPVNMRGPIARTPDTCNHASFVFADLTGCSSARQVHERLSERFAARAYWGAWDSINLARFIGVRGLRRIARRNVRRGNPYRAVGCFSNHGDWLLPVESEAAQRRWFICPPVLRDQPFSAGSLLCDGRLSLCLQAHPALTVDRARADHWMQSWRAELAALSPACDRGRAASGAR